MKIYNKVHKYIINLPYQVKAALATLVVGTLSLPAAEEKHQPKEDAKQKAKTISVDTRITYPYAVNYNGLAQNNTYVLRNNDTINNGVTNNVQKKASGEEQTLTGGDFGVKFTIKGKTVTYYYPGDSVVVLKGNIPNRQNNPGALKYGEFAKSHGAIGKGSRGFAIFPSAEAGIDALKALLQSDSYKNLTIFEAMKRFAPECENDPKAYANKIRKATGIDAAKKLYELTEDEIILVVHKIAVTEGFNRFSAVPQFMQEVQYARNAR